MASVVETLLAGIRQGLQAVSGESAVYSALSAAPSFSHSPALIAIGKAADSMLRGALQALEARRQRPVAVFSITKTDHGRTETAQWLAEAGIPAVLLESSHPVPDDRSLTAGERLRQWIAALPADQPVEVLISGGASSLVEALPRGWTLAQWQALNQWLLGSGWSIGEINRVRAAFSCLKGGGLARWLAPRPVRGWLISDVPGDDPALIGSGLLSPVPLPSATQWQRLPAPWRGLPRCAQRTSSPAVPLQIVASNQHAVEAVCRAVPFPLRQGEPLFCAVDEAVPVLLSAKQPMIWGGETTVRLPTSPGMGGRNQHLALMMARALAEKKRGGTFLSVGTDGTDGPTPWAGAWVDEQTWQRARQQGLNPDRALAQCDATPVLEALGQLIRTGPTGTNVMDLMVFLPADSVQ